jgi:hypothetical protein
MSADVAVEPMAASEISDRYETLRGAVLGAGLPLEVRSGLALFLRRGMWGWAQAVAIPSTARRPTCSPVATGAAQGEQRTVIHLLAALAVRSNQWRPYERIAQSRVASPGA